MALFGHFNSREACFLPSMRELERQLEKAGFHVMMRYKNMTRRFVNWNDLHILARKPQYEDMDGDKTTLREFR